MAPTRKLAKLFYDLRARTEGLEQDLDKSEKADFLSSATGPSFKQIEEVAKSLGITLNGTKQSYLDFLAALKSADLKSVTSGFERAIRQLEIDAQLDPSAFQGIDGVVKRIKVLTGPDGALAIGKALEGLDLSTPEGRAQAIEKLSPILPNLTSLEVSDLGGLSLQQFIEQFLSVVSGLRDAEPAVRSAAEQYSAAFDAWNAALQAGGTTTAEFLDKLTRTFQQDFPNLLSEAVISSLDAFKKRVGELVTGFAADRGLSDAEKSQIAALNQLVDAYRATSDAMVDMSDVLDEEFKLFDTSLDDQFRATFDDLVKKFPAIGDLIDPADIDTPEGRANITKAIQERFTEPSSDDIIESEKSFFDALVQLFGIVGEVGDEAAKDAEASAKQPAAVSKKIIDDAEMYIRVHDISDPAEQLQIRLKAVARAFPELDAAIGDLDVTTQAGRDALESLIQAMLDHPDALAAMAETLGVAFDDLVWTFTNLEDGPDSANDAVQSLANQLVAAFAEQDFQDILDNITDPLEKLSRRAKAAGQAIPAVANALKGLDLSTESGRRSAEAALVVLGRATSDSSTRDAIQTLLEQIRGAGNAAAGAGVSGAPGTGTSSSLTNVASAASITEVSANRWLDIMTTDLVLSRERNAILNEICASVSRAPQFSPPALASLGAAAQPPILNNISIPVYFQGPVTTADATELSARLQETLYRFVA